MLETLENRSAVLEREPLRPALSAFQELKAIYESVAGAPAAVGPGELRRLCCEAFAGFFEGTDHLVMGREHLPEEPGHVFVMNHLSNHLSDLFPDDFVPTLDTHFVSAMVLHKKYGEAPVRVVREPNPGEHDHRSYYARLGHVCVYSKGSNFLPQGSYDAPEERRRRFLEAAGGHLRRGRNVLICPEGVSARTEDSPLPFKTGAFRLAAHVRPEPLIVPIAVANFDKEVGSARTAAVVHEPIRLSEHLEGPLDDASLHEFVNVYVHELYKCYVREAVRLTGGTSTMPANDGEPLFNTT